MKSFLSALLLLCVASTVNVYSQCANSAFIFSFKYNEKKYEVIRQERTWSDAAKCAVERGGRLWEINDKQEEDSVLAKIKLTVPADYKSLTDGGNACYVWIGASDINKEGKWMWDGKNDNNGVNFWNGQGTAGDNSGKAVEGAYVHWGGASKNEINEPDNAGTGQNAAGIALSNWIYGAAGEWNDLNETNKLYYVVEYDSVKADVDITPELNDLMLSPNPIKDVLTIKNLNKDSQILGISLYNSAGTLVSTFDIKSEDNISLDLSGYPKGVYFISFKYANGIEKQSKIVVE